MNKKANQKKPSSVGKALCVIVLVCVSGCVLTELPDCAALHCGSDARCFEDTTFGKLVCKCLPGYFGDGVQCSCKYSCGGSAKNISRVHFRCLFQPN